jgi:hypothetical protein
MKKKTIQIVSKWICCLLVFTLVVSCLPMNEWAAPATNTEDKENATPVSEKTDAERINQEIAKKQPDVPAPPVEAAQKGPVASQQDENVEVVQTKEGTYNNKVYLDPVQRQDDQKKWQEISTNLEINQKEQTIEPENAAIDVAFEQKTDEGTYATVQDDENKVEYRFEGAEGNNLSLLLQMWQLNTKTIKSFIEMCYRIWTCEIRYLINRSRKISFFKNIKVTINFAFMYLQN